MKHEHQHKGHGMHGHKGPHEHYTDPGAGHSGHSGDGVRSLVHDGKGPPMHESATYTADVDEGAAHHKGSGGESTGGTRNRI